MSYDCDPFEPVWFTRDDDSMIVRDMERHHAWNALRMLRRNGRTGTFTAASLNAHIGTVSRKETLWFWLRNIFFEVTHPFWRLTR